MGICWTNGIARSLLPEPGFLDPFIDHGCRFLVFLVTRHHGLREVGQDLAGNDGSGIRFHHRIRDFFSADRGSGIARGGEDGNPLLQIVGISREHVNRLMFEQP